LFGGSFEFGLSDQAQIDSMVISRNKTPNMYSLDKLIVNADPKGKVLQLFMNILKRQFPKESEFNIYCSNRESVFPGSFKTSIEAVITPPIVAGEATGNGKKGGGKISSETAKKFKEAAASLNGLAKAVNDDINPAVGFSGGGRRNSQKRKKRATKKRKNNANNAKKANNSKKANNAKKASKKKRRRRSRSQKKRGNNLN
jgi:hypothetical protein